jgi:hypothetical protein
MNLSSAAAASLAATALVLAVAACGHGEQSSEPEITQPAPDDSAYTGAAGRKEDGAAAEQSASGELPQDQQSAPQQ